MFVGLHVVASLNYLLSELIGVLGKEAKILCIILQNCTDVSCKTIRGGPVMISRWNIG